MVRARALVTGALAVALAIGGLTACGDDDDGVADDRAAQVRDAAREAGLSDDVIAVLELATRGATATFQVTYAGEDGAGLVVSQAPPNRRVDVLAGDIIVSSRVLRDGIGYRCELPEGADAADLDCSRSASNLDAPGAFTADAITAFAEDLIATKDDLVLTVDERTIAETDATCLISSPTPGTPLDGAGATVDTICLSPEGAQLLIDTGGDRVVADQYTTDVPDGTFDV